MTVTHKVYTNTPTLIKWLKHFQKYAKPILVIFDKLISYTSLEAVIAKIKPHTPAYLIAVTKLDLLIVVFSDQSRLWIHEMLLIQENPSAFIIWLNHSR